MAEELRRRGYSITPQYCWKRNDGQGIIHLDLAIGGKKVFIEVGDEEDHEQRWESDEQRQKEVQSRGWEIIEIENWNIDDHNELLKATDEVEDDLKEIQEDRDDRLF